jgi:hypothetical protein
MLKHKEHDKAIDTYIFCQKHITDGLEVLKEEGPKGLENSKDQKGVKMKQYEQYIINESSKAFKKLELKEQIKLNKINNMGITFE